MSSTGIRFKIQLLCFDCVYMLLWMKLSRQITNLCYHYCSNWKGWMRALQMETTRVKFNQTREFSHDSPALSDILKPAQPPIGVQLFSIDPSVFFWRTGPECDVVSLPRQKGQARSPPSGHRLLSCTGAQPVIITERLSQVSSFAYGKCGTGREDTSVKEAWKRPGQEKLSAELKPCQQHGSGWQWAWRLHGYSVSRVLWIVVVLWSLY